MQSCEGGEAIKQFLEMLQLHSVRLDHKKGVVSILQRRARQGVNNGVLQDAMLGVQENHLL